MLVVPTPTIPKQLQQYIQSDSKAIRKMLNGYRNRLTKNLQWVLSANDNYCGQGFCYNVIQDNDKLLQKIKQYEDKQCKIDVIQNQQNHYVLVCKNNVEFYNPKIEKISQANLKRILEELGLSESQRVAKNLLLNIFDSYEELKESQLQKFIHQYPNTIDTTGKQNKQLNNLAGKMLLLVPQYDSKTGLWSNQHKYQLKIEKNSQIS